MSNKSLFEKPVSELMKENLKNAVFNSEIPESSGLSDELTEEDIKENMRFLKGEQSDGKN